MNHHSTAPADSREPAAVPASPLSIALDMDVLFKAGRDQTVRQVLNDLLCTAIESGSHYWAGSCLLAPETQPTTGSPWYVNAFDLGLRMQVSEVEDADDEDGFTWHPLTFEIAAEGLKRLAIQYPGKFFSIVEGQDDADDADAWLQLSILGELRYG